MSDATSGPGHVAFFSNQIRTHFYAQVAARLRARGVRVSWVATSQRWAKVARAKAGVAEADILDLSRESDWTDGRTPTAEEYALLARVEQAGGLSIKDMQIMDRELNLRPWNIGLAYAASVARRLDRFFAGRGVDLCLGETTWCGELVASQLVRLHGVVYAHPTTVRIPSENFALLVDAATDRLFEWAEPTPEHHSRAREIAETYKKGASAPYYMSSIPSPFKWRSHWAKEATVALFSARNGPDYTVPALHTRATRRLRFAWDAMRARRQPFVMGPSRPDAPYVFVTLHYQPEASVDVWGAPFNNQIETIRALSRILPVGYEILVKEHRAALGCRSAAEYDEMSRIPGVWLVHPSAQTPVLMRDARLVASAAGTACYEAALMNVPAVCFGRIFFGDGLLRQAFDPFSMDRAGMATFLDEAAKQQASGELGRRAENLVARVLANSFVGRFGDPTDAMSMSDENLGVYTDGIFTGLTKIRERANSLRN